ncbi:unnamed protein product [Didymodactylos carnosus]|uniref:Carbohydrate kinase PfkB domain-containing protein n=1 Tax=Didymodactylos carnosus TaxID=1234261 RepID=A0A813TDH7_9BILA|nr:unnamed protein product [Didymodactylos carnosus]CAF3596741.1 unnamed protein product [Didymodactylos carnosus]
MSEKLVLTFGAACIDYIAVFDTFPKPEDKVRTQSLTLCGGGNAGNTSTCLSRLNINTKIVCKIGDDGNGKKILQDFKNDNVNTQEVLIKQGMTTSLTYVIVDITNATRTCLFSPSAEEILVDDVKKLGQSWLNGIDLVHFDSRSTPAAVELARLVKQNNILCTLDLEKYRPSLENLLLLIDYIVTTERYSLSCNETPVTTAVRLLKSDRCKFVVITKGKDGSMLVQKRILENKNENFNRVSKENIVYDDIEYDVINCPSWPIDQKDTMDTTGAGDAFIGGIIFSILQKWSIEKMMCFASYVAMRKLKGLGARMTLPRLDEINFSIFD